MPDFQFCQVCRINHNQGRGHKYSTKHKQRLDAFLSKALQKIKDVKFFLRFPAKLRETDRRANAFWCSFCEENISEDDSVFVCSNTIKHLASSKHLGVLKKFWHDNGADVEKRHLYAFQSEQLAKWEDSCQALLATCNSMETSAVTLNNIHTESFCSKTTPLKGFSISSFANSNLSDPSPSCKDGIFRNYDLLGGTSNDNNCHSNPSMPSSTQMYACQDQTESLTCIRQQDSTPGLGSVHTGAPPPWLHIISETKEQSSTTGSSKGTKHRNPKRVGAAWAEKRRAEMAAAASGKPLQKGPVIGKGWLPNFGRVWQSGSRRETRKEYESEKKVESNLDIKPKVYQPYVSKRQRLEASSEPEMANI